MKSAFGIDPGGYSGSGWVTRDVVVSIADEKEVEFVCLGL